MRSGCHWWRSIPLTHLSFIFSYETLDSSCGVLLLSQLVIALINIKKRYWKNIVKRFGEVDMTFKPWSYMTLPFIVKCNLKKMYEGMAPTLKNWHSWLWARTQRDPNLLDILEWASINNPSLIKPQTKTFVVTLFFISRNFFIIVTI